MSSHGTLPPLRMSNIIAADAPLTSPISDVQPVSWDVMYDLALAPAPTASLPSSDPRLAMRCPRMSPDAPPEQCLPTHQLFDFPLPVSLSASSPGGSPDSSPHASPMPQYQRLQSAGSVVVPAKRPSSSAGSSSSGASAPKKPRGERVTTKDFVPPDVSGLSKREARLVKNRAAAFLSRQRKREEFETMEIRVAELEQENARLMALAQQKTQPQSQPEPAHQEEELLSEVEQLRRQLAETQQRERELAAKLESVPAPAPVVKVETVEPQLTASSLRAHAHKDSRSGASFGLMVLLCALPTLLSMPTHSTLPTTYSFNPSTASSYSALDMPTYPQSDYDWALGTTSSSIGHGMDLDLDLDASAKTEKKLEFVDLDAEKLGLGGLDISFDASAARDGKIRVRIHPQGGSTATSVNGDAAEDMSMATDSQNTDIDDLGPFLGVGSMDHDDAFGYNAPYGLFGSSSHSSLDSHYPSHTLAAPSPTSSSLSGVPGLTSSGPGEYDFEFGSEYEYGSVGSGMSRAGSPGMSGGKKRVRIALRSMPGKGNEGGEWEVEVC